ncbi:D-alanine--D-alanine ligase family protein [Photobacterium halotolerans]|uniref:D-alanine--D-alanine ligase n=1 Tax=Photobacterium halotolerans TaxID=265726 RepID=A0A0F5VIS6_9GAMM|nr:D-alanine--D-alanine ligase [Photobacterium halotolerans]KKD01742.1 D-alanine--D-alanine ligase [Photobacterium halotolerans]
MRVGVLMGGESSERSVSLRSGHAVCEAIDELGHEAIAIDPVSLHATLEALQSVDKVFIALHGSLGESGHIQGLLDWLKIPYTGSGLATSALCLNKRRTRQILAQHGFHYANWVVVDRQQSLQAIQSAADAIGYPLVVKPSSQGCSIGVSKVESPAQLEAAVMQAFEYDHDILLEAFISGREYTCGILGDTALPVVQIRSETFFDWTAKFGAQTATYHCPSDLDSDTERAIQQLSLSAFQALGCRGWGRLDVILGDDGQLYPIEMNTSPGMTQRSVYPMASREIGLDFPRTIEQILALATFDPV